MNKAAERAQVDAKIRECMKIGKQIKGVFLDKYAQIERRIADDLRMKSGDSDSEREEA